VPFWLTPAPKWRADGALPGPGAPRRRSIRGSALRRAAAGPAPGSARGTLRALCRPPSAPAHEPTALRRQGPPGPLPARQLLSRPQFLLQSTRQLEVLGASIRFVQDVEVHPAHPDASE